MVSQDGLPGRSRGGLIKHGANKNVRALDVPDQLPQEQPDKGKTALEYVEALGHAEIVALLRSAS